MISFPQCPTLGNSYITWMNPLNNLAESLKDVYSNSPKLDLMLCLMKPAFKKTSCRNKYIYIYIYKYIVAKYYHRGKNSVSSKEKSQSDMGNNPLLILSLTIKTLKFKT